MMVCPFTPEDLLCNPLAIGDYVVFHNCIYTVIGLGKASMHEWSPRAEGPIRIKLLHAGKTNRPVNKASRDVVKVSAEDVKRLLEMENMRARERAEMRERMLNTASIPLTIP